MLKWSPLGPPMQTSLSEGLSISYLCCSESPIAFPAEVELPMEVSSPQRDIQNAVVWAQSKPSLKLLGAASVCSLLPCGQFGEKARQAITSVFSCDPVISRIIPLYLVCVCLACISWSMCLGEDNGQEDGRAEGCPVMEGLVPIPSSQCGDTGTKMQPVIFYSHINFWFFSARAS